MERTHSGIFGFLAKCHSDSLFGDGDAPEQSRIVHLSPFVAITPRFI